MLLSVSFNIGVVCFYRLCRGLLGLVFSIFVWTDLGAFPPNPHYTIFGMVRDQVGNTLQVEGAELVLLSNTVEIGRAPIRTTPVMDLNYELDIRIDQARPTTRVYTANAVASRGLYSLYVVMNGERYYPIEVAGNLRAGNGGERVRLDLTLGADANKDGLPDVWQEWVLFQAGRTPGTPGWSIDLITRSGDFDGDGISNWDEYVAGTFAGDATKTFELKLTGKTQTTVTFEFFALTGKVYSLEESADLKTWSAATLAISTAPATTALFYRATSSGIKSGSVAVGPGQSRFYHLVVR